MCSNVFMSFQRIDFSRELLLLNLFRASQVSWGCPLNWFFSKLTWKKYCWLSYWIAIRFRHVPIANAAREELECFRHPKITIFCIIVGDSFCVIFSTFVRIISISVVCVWVRLNAGEVPHRFGWERIITSRIICAFQWSPFLLHVNLYLSYAIQRKFSLRAQGIGIDWVHVDLRK